jgi:hypothetical protein
MRSTALDSRIAADFLLRGTQCVFCCSSTSPNNAVMKYKGGEGVTLFLKPSG